MADELMRRYRGRVIFGPFVPVDPGEVTALEAAIGRPLPADYRAFLDAANGGRLEYAIRLPASAGGEVLGFTDVHQVGRDQRGEYGYGTLLGEYRRHAESAAVGQLPVEDLLPIAVDGGGDTLYLDVGSRTPGRLLAFVHGLPEWTGLAGHDVFPVVSDSFDAYLDSLFIEADIAQLTWEDAKDADPADEWRRVVVAWLDEGLPNWRDRPWAPH
jgi:hypothetical protein